jgi:gamma-glutamyl-gamma-aminobutyrate hydrolase PuuD
VSAPVIAIGGDLKATPVEVVRIKLSYVEAVRRAGGIPLVLPCLDEREIGIALERVDGVILSGGDDVDPRERGVALHAQAFPMDPRRQKAELALAHAVAQRNLPTLGICLGMQVLCFAAGGELFQHLPDSGIEGVLDHRAAHPVELMPGSRLAALLGTHLPYVVSHHHQGVSRVPAGYRQVGRASDGVIEAIESTDGRFLYGVQWHPERSPETADSKALFRALVEAARRK